MKSLKCNFLLCSGKYDITNILIIILNKNVEKKEGLN